MSERDFATEFERHKCYFLPVPILHFDTAIVTLSGGSKSDELTSTKEFYPSLKMGIFDWSPKGPWWLELFWNGVVPNIKTAKVNLHKKKAPGNSHWFDWLNMSKTWATRNKHTQTHGPRHYKFSSFNLLCICHQKYFSIGAKRSHIYENCDQT